MKLMFILVWFGCWVGMILAAAYLPPLLGLSVSLVWGTLCVFVGHKLLYGER